MSEGTFLYEILSKFSAGAIVEHHEEEKKPKVNLPPLDHIVNLFDFESLAKHTLTAEVPP
jgi:hypothetical protein